MRKAILHYLIFDSTILYKALVKCNTKGTQTFNLSFSLEAWNKTKLHREKDISKYMENGHCYSLSCSIKSGPDEGEEKVNIDMIREMMCF